MGDGIGGQQQYSDVNLWARIIKDAVGGGEPIFFGSNRAVARIFHTTRGDGSGVRHAILSSAAVVLLWGRQLLAEGAALVVLVLD